MPIGVDEMERMDGAKHMDEAKDKQDIYGFLCRFLPSKAELRLEYT